MNTQLPATLFIVDDDPAMRRALVGVGQVLELPVKAFASARDFLAAYDRAQPGCLVLDLKMPDMTGLELQQSLIDDNIGLPVIMISGHATVPTAVEVMSKGAVTFLEKPFAMHDLLHHVRRAIEQDRATRVGQAKQAEGAALLSQMTTKEREVLDLVTAGKTNKEIAAHLGLSIRAVEDRRARLMKKLEVRSVAELVLVAARQEALLPRKWPTERPGVEPKTAM